MPTHPQVVTVAPGAPLEVRHVETPVPKDNEVRVRVEWTASTPLDMHQAIGGLLVQRPQGLGDTVAGTVVESGPQARYQPGDRVFGFTWQTNPAKAHQLYCTTPDTFLGLIPEGFSMQQVVTLPDNFVTAWYTITNEFGFELPWPKPQGYTPPRSNSDWILIWGGSSSAGQFTLQILKHYGFTNILATASTQHHEKLKQYGATQCFDYRSPSVQADIDSYLAAQPVTDSANSHNRITHILDCIASLPSSLLPLTRLPLNVLAPDTTVAILLPVITRHAQPDSNNITKPEYGMEVTAPSIPWPASTSQSDSIRIHPRGVRTHFYPQVKYLADHLQQEIMPTALREGWIQPNKQRIVEGKTLLDRAQRAIGILCGLEGGVSGERLVWRVAEEGQGEKQ